MRFTVRSGSGEFGSFRVILETPEDALRVAQDLMEGGATEVRIIDQQGRVDDVEALGRELRGHNLTDGQLALVAGTADVLAATDTRAADLFYDKLFELAPEVRRLFKDDLADQKRKLLDMLASLLLQATDPEGFKRGLRELGLRHRAYGAKPAHYGPVGQALLHALRISLGQRFSVEVEAAWTTLYLDVAALMVAEAKAQPGSEAELATSS